jgi:hypothetical protein
VRPKTFIQLATLLAVCFVLIAIPACKPRAKIETKEQRLAWNLKTTTEAYDLAGHTNAIWDAPAKRALTEFAKLLSRQTEMIDSQEIIATNVTAAMEAGCDDPLVDYLHVKFALDPDSSKETFAEAFIKAAREMNRSTYPPIRKFYASLRTVDQLYYTDGTNVKSNPALNEFYPQLEANLDAFLADKTMPAQDACDAAEAMLSFAGMSRKYYALTYQRIEKPMLENWPNADTTWVLKGSAYIKMAWDARGGDWASKVTPEGWKEFGKDLAIAHEAFDKAWKLNPKNIQIPMQMMTVELGESGNLDEFNVWFNRAMKLDPNSYAACEKKLYYLAPKWFGSREAMLAFGRECLTSTNWGGSVPLILPDAHYQYWSDLRDPTEQSNYWKLPDVWPDIAVAYDHFFELNPDQTHYYHNYAWYAYRCEQWDKLNELIPKLGEINYNYFGGKEAFDKMIQAAKAHLGKAR